MTGSDYENTFREHSLSDFMHAHQTQLCLALMGVSVLFVALGIIASIALVGANVSGAPSFMSSLNHIISGSGNWSVYTMLGAGAIGTMIFSVCSFLVFMRCMRRCCRSGEEDLLYIAPTPMNSTTSDRGNS